MAFLLPALTLFLASLISSVYATIGKFTITCHLFFYEDHEEIYIRWEGGGFNIFDQIGS